MEVGYNQNYGARPLKRAIQKNVETAISTAIIVSGFSETEQVRETETLGVGVYVKKA